MKIDWSKVVTFLKKYWYYIVAALLIFIVAYFFGKRAGFSTLLATVAGGVTASEVIKNNQKRREARGKVADVLLEKAKNKKDTKTKTYLIFGIVILLMFSFTAKAAPGTVPLDEYLIVVNRVAELQEQVADLEERLALATQAAELYKQNWQDAESDIDLLTKDNELLEKDKLALITQIGKLQSKKLGVQGLMIYDGTIKVALMGSYSNIIAGVSYDINKEALGVAVGVKADF